MNSGYMNNVTVTQPVGNRKFYGQATNLTSFPRTLWV